MKIRKKASDVFLETNYFMRNKTTFEKAFPQIEDLKILVEESGEGVSDGKGVSYFNNDSGEYVNCSNPLCYNGGFSVGGILRNMVQDKQTHYEGTKFCKGYEGSPKGRIKYEDCDNFFKVSVDIKYKNIQQQ